MSKDAQSRIEKLIDSLPQGDEQIARALRFFPSQYERYNNGEFLGAQDIQRELQGRNRNKLVGLMFRARDQYGIPRDTIPFLSADIEERDDEQGIVPQAPLQPVPQEQQSRAQSTIPPPPLQPVPRWLASLAILYSILYAETKNNEWGQVSILADIAVDDEQLENLVETMQKIVSRILSLPNDVTQKHRTIVTSLSELVKDIVMDGSLPTKNAHLYTGNNVTYTAEEVKRFNAMRELIRDVNLKQFYADVSDILDEYVQYED
jgi:ASC-1-like (ASCH) protein